MDLDTLNIIFEFLDFISKIRFRQISKYFINNFYIHDFYGLDKIYLEKLTEKILISYPKIKYLDIMENKSIQNINFLSNLYRLAISDKFQNQFDNYNLRELNICNYIITNLKYFTKLDKLILNNSPITNSDLDYLNLRELCLIDCQVSNINHMTRLKKLFISRNSKIQNSNIQNLELTKLDIEGHIGITKINYLTNLQYLTIYYSNITYDLSGINLRKLYIYQNNSDFSQMTNLTKLRMVNCPKINLSKINLFDLCIQYTKSDFSHMTNLTRLNMATNYYRISLNNLTNLKYLNCSHTTILDGDILNINPKKIDISYTNITNIAHMTNLRKLRANNSKITEITNPNLKKIKIDSETIIKIINLPKLKYLLTDGQNLEQLNSPKLSILNLSHSNKITNLNNLINLKNLALEDNKSITDLNYLTSLKILKISGKSGLTNTSIQKLNLLELKLDDNTTITDINNLTNLKKLTIIGPDTGLDNLGVRNLDKNKIKINQSYIRDSIKI